MFEVDSHLLKVKFPETSLLQLWGKILLKILSFILQMAEVKFFLYCSIFFLLEYPRINTWKCNLLLYLQFLFLIRITISGHHQLLLCDKFWFSTIQLDNLHWACFVFFPKITCWTEIHGHKHCNLSANNTFEVKDEWNWKGQNQFDFL